MSVCIVSVCVCVCINRLQLKIYLLFVSRRHTLEYNQNWSKRDKASPPSPLLSPMSHLLRTLYHSIDSYAKQNSTICPSVHIKPLYEQNESMRLRVVHAHLFRCDKSTAKCYLHKRQTFTHPSRLSLSAQRQTAPRAQQKKM